jgi:hypothetical protein
MVSTHDRSADVETAQPDGHSSPPLTLAQVFASIRESRVEQTELLHLLMTNSNRGGTAVDNAQDHARSTYVEFLTTQLPTFAKASEPLEANHWLCTMESKLPRTRRHSLQPSSCWAMLGHGGPISPPLVLLTKCNGPSSVKLSVRNISKQALWWESTESSWIYNSATDQCTPTPSCSTKLQECLALNTGRPFLEFVSNAIIVDDAVRTHKESKKKKALVAPSDSAPAKY